MVNNVHHHFVSNVTGWNNSGFWNNAQPRSNHAGPAGFPGFGVNQAQTTPANRNAILQIRQAAEVLRNAVRNVRGAGRGTVSPFGAHTAVSADTARLAVTGADAQRMRAANVTDFQVDVVALAQAQRNEGAALASADMATQAGFTLGEQRLSIHVGDRQFDINFTVSATDTVGDVQNRIANAVNARNIGVRASVTVAGEQSALVLQSAQTGIRTAGEPNFTVSGDAGNAAALLAVNNVTETAQNAQFRVIRNRDGRQIAGALTTSQTNDVNLGFGITGELRQTGRVAVNVQRDTTAETSAARGLADAFNTLMREAQRNANTQPNARTREGSRLEQDLIGAFNTFRPGLNRIGISMNRDGLLQIDEDRMRAAAESGALERFFQDGGRSNSGFVNRLDRIAENTIRNPARFAETPQGGHFTNSFNHRRLNNLANVGLLFDMWI